MGASGGNEPRLAGEQLLHHGLLEVAGLVAAGFQRRQSASMSERTAAMAVCSGSDGGIDTRRLASVRLGRLSSYGLQPIARPSMSMLHGQDA